MRDQLVARRRFYPLRTNPARRELWFASRIQVRLYFDAPARLQAAATDANTSVPRPDPLAPRTSSFDEALSSTLLNYQQALTWRIPRSQAQVLLGPGMQGQTAAPNTEAQRYRVETIEPGLTEISYAALAAAGAPVDDIDPATIRLEKNCTEIAIEVKGSADGIVYGEI